MSRFDSDSATASGANSEVVQGLRGAARLVEQHEIAVKTAVFFAVTTALGVGWHSVATHQFGNNMSALLIWFSLIFAAAAALLGLVLKLQAAVSSLLADRR